MGTKKILVPVSGGKIDEEAVNLACGIAKKNKATVYAIYVIEVKRTLPLDADITFESRKGEDVLGWVERLAEEQDYQVETELLQAREAGQAIVDEAVERDVDLIIMGINYKRRFGEFTLGQTVPYVLKNARCKVVLCREAPSMPSV